jgi:FkbM family methyltransferase
MIVIAMCVLYFHDLYASNKVNSSRTYAGLSQKKSHLINRGEKLRNARLDFLNISTYCGVEGELAIYLTETGYFPICVHSKEDMISTRIRQYGLWDDCEDLVSFIWNEFEGGPGRNTAKQRLNIIDVGANIGSCSIRLALLGHRLLSFEPIDGNYKLFEKSIRLNNLSESLQLIKAGASDFDGEASSVIEKGNAGNAIVLSAQSSDREVGRIEEMVRSLTNSTFSRPHAVSLVQLDSYIRDLDYVHLLKLDCQGCEPAALRGADVSLRAGRVRSIVAEFSPPHLHAAGEDPAGLLEALAARGFAVSTLVLGTRVAPARFRDFAARRHAAPILLHARHAAPAADAARRPLAAILVVCAGVAGVAVWSLCAWGRGRGGGTWGKAD